MSLIRLAAKLTAAKNRIESEKQSNTVESEKRHRSQQTGEEVIKSSLTNPVELASIKSRPLLPPASPPLFFLTIPSLSSNRFMHFHSQLFAVFCLQPSISNSSLCLSSCSHGYPMTLSMFAIVKGFYLIAASAPSFMSFLLLLLSTVTSVTFTALVLPSFSSLPYLLPCFPFPPSTPTEDDSQEKPTGGLSWQLQTGSCRWGDREGVEGPFWFKCMCNVWDFS